MYMIVFTPDIETGGYIASVPVLPGCYSQGDTLVDAYKNILEAIDLHVESLKTDGWEVPD